jgi:hypothetical protein
MKIKITKKKTRSSEHGKEMSRRYEQTPHRKAWHKTWAKTPKGRAVQFRGNHSDSRRVSRKRSKVMIAIGSKICKMLRNGGLESGTVSASTQFGTNDELRSHLTTTFDTGMHFGNHGNGAGHWHVGHRIARAMYDPSDPEDVRRCWSKPNIFAQWGDENLELGVKLPDDATLHSLIELKLEPKAWGGVFPDSDMRARRECAARARKV